MSKSRQVKLVASNLFPSAVCAIYLAERIRSVFLTTKMWVEVDGCDSYLYSNVYYVVREWTGTTGSTEYLAGEWDNIYTRAY